ncbi:hypothetical protein D9M68_208140 [compost metagenome]
MFTDNFGRLFAEFFQMARVDVELDDFALGVALQCLVEDHVPLVAEPQHAQDAIVGEVAAKLLRHAHAHVLDDLFGLAHMRRKFGNRFEDQVQVADRDALGKQQLQHGLQAGIGHVRGANFVGKLAVFRIEPFDQHLHVLVGEQVRQVVANDLAQMRQHYRDVIDRVEAFALQVFGEGFEDRNRRHAEGGFADLVARHARPAAAACHHQHFADTHSVRGDRRTVDTDMIGLVRNADVVGHLDFGNDEAVLPGEFAAHLTDAEGQFLVGAEQARRDLFAEEKLDLGGLQHRFDGIRLAFLGLLDLGGLLGAAGRIGRFDLARHEPAQKRHAAAENGEG